MFLWKKKFKVSCNPEEYLDFWQDKIVELAPEVALGGACVLDFGVFPKEIESKLRHSIRKSCIDAEVLDEWIYFVRERLSSKAESDSALFK
ncbi:MAG: hypothetical protein LBL30_02105 [Holosporales bacterium]|jgi:hypothetical protein|nr:hypothetical protein [Holosporales bacterium]